MDKVQKIREEVERLKRWNDNVRESTRHMTLQEEDFNRGKHSSYLEILNFIDSMQEEPVSSIWHDTSEPPIIDKTFLLVAPNGNSSLCLWGGKELHSVTIGGGHSVLCKGDIYSYIDDLLNLDNSCNFGKNLQEEPVSHGQVKESMKIQHVNNTCKENGNSLTQEPVSEDLGDYINELSKQFPEVSFAKLSRIAVRVAKWQAEQIKKAMDLGEPPYLISVEQAYYRTLKLLEE